MKKSNSILTLVTTIAVSLSALVTPLTNVSAEITHETELSSSYSRSSNYLQANNVTINADILDMQGEYLETTLLSDYSKNILSRIEEYYNSIEDFCIGTDEYTTEIDTYCTGDYKIYASSVYNDKTIITDGLTSMNCTTFIGNNSILYSTENDIIFNCGNIEYSGIIYAPEGKVCINATTAKFSGVIIAKTLEFNCDSLTLSPDYSFIDTDEKFDAEEIITFDSINSEFENGVDKLIACGYESNFIDTIPKDVVEQIATSSEVINKTSFYKEVLLCDENEEETAIVVPSSNEEFDYRTSLGNTEIDNSVDNNASMFAIKKNLDSGTLKVTTSYYAISGAQPSQYLVMSSFIWTTMPKYRGSDFFGITRDSDTCVIPGTFGASTTYYQQKYYYLANVGGVTRYRVGNPTIIQKTSYKNQSSDPLKGFAIKFSVPANNIPVTMLAGSSAYGYLRYGLNGGCWYQGVLRYPNSSQNFNHWSTYCHQKSTTWSISPSVSIPLGASISVSPKKSYSTPVVDTILTTYKKK